MSTHYAIEGSSAKEIVASVESGVRSGELGARSRLPTVRALAARLELSPGTVAAAYATLRRRGIVGTDGRRGTRVLPRPTVVSRSQSRLPVPPGARDLSGGEPEAALLPALGPRLRHLSPEPVTYSAGGLLPAFTDVATARLVRDGVPARRVTATSGGLDGIERVLATRLAPGDAVAVEDPGWSSVLDLLAGMNLRAVPVPVDDDGPSVAGVDRAIRDGAAALLVTNRAQNPTGATLSAGRAHALRSLLSDHDPQDQGDHDQNHHDSDHHDSDHHDRDDRHGRVAGLGPGLLVIEDDHAAELAAEPLQTLAGATRAWAFVRSVSKPYGPDLRCAVLAADDETLARVEGRHVLGARWVSTVLQALVVALWSDPETDALVERAGRRYDENRRALLDALAERGVSGHGRSGLNVWIPVDDETTACARLLEAGWVAAPGRMFRIRSAPGIRLTISTLGPHDIAPLADAVTAARHPVAPRPAV